MPHTLVIAEKPSVARDISRVLGCRSKGDGFFTGEGWCVSWALGHLVTLMEPEELEPRYKQWRAEDLPILPEQMRLKVVAKTKAQFAVLKRLLNDPATTDIVCATDAGREGELIFRYIYEMAGCRKPVRRLWISSMTDEAIREGFASLKPSAAYDTLFESARCRSQADWLVGMNASRAFTLRYHALLSVGRVQTPTLQMLVKRRQEIEAFVPEPYWLVQADFGDYQGTWFDPAREGDKRIRDEARAKDIAHRVRGQMAAVVEATREEKRDLPPQLYDLTSLQREANQLLGFTAQKTLSTAQSLYEQHKLLTYPRTDSRYLPQEMAARVKQTLGALGEPYAPWAARVLAKPLPAGRRVFDDAKVTDHHAILPTPKRANLDALPPDARRLYDLVARRAVAAFLPPYRYEALRAVTQAAGEHFVSTGRVELEAGWKELYRDLSPKKTDKEQEEQTLPALAVGDARQVVSAKVKKESTKAPSPHTDASLLYAMEHAGREIEDEALREGMRAHGLGTPATRAAILERLITVGYAQRHGKQLRATDKGVQLIAVVPPDIASPETTGRWEKGLADIAAGAASPERFLEGIRRLAAHLTHYAAAEAPTVAFAPEQRGAGKGKRRAAVKPLDIPCPLCSTGHVTETSKAFGCSRWKEGCKLTLWKDTAKRAGGPALTAALVTRLLRDGAVRGTTGTLRWADGRVSFAPAAALTAPAGKQNATKS